MEFKKDKYIGFLGFISLIGLKGFTTENYLWFLFFVNYLWFTFFYENSLVYKEFSCKSFLKKSGVKNIH